MNAAQLLSSLAQVLFVTVFLVAAYRAARAPQPVNLATAAFFGIAAATVVITWSLDALGIEEPRAPVPALQVALLLAWPYPLLRLLHEFAEVPAVILRAVEVGLVAVVLILAAGGGTLPALVVPVVALYYVGAFAYTGVRFRRAARVRTSVLRHRMQAAAAGSMLVGLLLLWLLPSGADPDGPWSGLASLTTSLAGLAYVVAFVTPALLRDAWQTPELRRFISETALVAPTDAGGLSTLAVAVEENAARVMGAPVVLLLADAESGELARPAGQGRDAEAEAGPGPASAIGARSFLLQQPVFYEDPRADDPANAGLYGSAGVRALKAAPVSTGDRRLGVLVAVLDHPPLVRGDELRLLEMLADHVAVILRNRELLAEAAEVAAERASLRMRDEFLTAAAHDLKTPLTTLLAQSQLMRRAARRDADARADLAGLERLVSESERMRRLVEDLLDASRADQDGLTAERHPADLLSIAHETVAALGEAGGRVVVEGEPVVAEVDRQRIAQVVENLLDNALKYSPGGGTVRLIVGSEQDQASVSVADSGVGIARADIPHIFDRFRRGAAVDDRRFSGIGLGLYLCKRIVDEHGGRISLMTEVNVGSTFTVYVPLQAARDGDRA